MISDTFIQFHDLVQTLANPENVGLDVTGNLRSDLNAQTHVRAADRVVEERTKSGETVLQSRLSDRAFFQSVLKHDNIIVMFQSDIRVLCGCEWNFKELAWELPRYSFPGIL